MSAYSPASGVTAIILFIVVSNSSGALATFRIFNDDDGTTYDETTQIAWDVDCLATIPNNIRGKIIMDDPDGNLAVRSSVNNALTFTGWGVEIT
jgi:hypothetical protein